LGKTTTPHTFFCNPLHFFATPFFFCEQIFAASITNIVLTALFDILEKHKIISSKQDDTFIKVKSVSAKVSYLFFERHD